MELTNPLFYGGFAFIGFILLELVYSKTHDNDELYEWKDLMASGIMGIGSAIIAPLVKVVFAVVLFKYTYEFFNPVIDGVPTNIMGYTSFGWAWYIWIICQLLDDFSYYWFHRMNHEVRILWAAHIVHHSSDNFNLGTAVRNGWFTVLYKPFFYVWIVAIGFHYEMLVVCMGIEALWQFQLHTKYVPKLGFLEKFLNLHTQHQVHHSRNIEYMDKNHGGYLNLFDRMFGTYKALDESIEIEYGVTKPPNSYNPLTILTHEYKDIWKDMKKSKKLKHKFMYMFGPPGWSHDGSTQTIKQIQRQMKAEAKAAKKANKANANLMATADK